MSNPLVKPKEKISPVIIDIEQVIAGLSLRLAKGEIDQGTFNRALDSLQSKEGPRPWA